MITIKYAKIENARFLSHLDMQTIIIRATKRAGYAARYSQGFNPHTILKMSNPIPLGVESEAEYFSIDIEDAKILSYFENIEKMFPAGIIINQIWETEKNPNISGITVSSKYIVRNIQKEKLQLILQEKERFNIVSASRTLGIIDIRVDRGALEVVLPSGNINYRIDRFISLINDFYDLSLAINDVKKIELFVGNDYEMRSADELLYELDLKYKEIFLGKKI